MKCNLEFCRLENDQLIRRIRTLEHERDRLDVPSPSPESSAEATVETAPKNTLRADGDTAKMVCQSHQFQPMQENRHHTHTYTHTHTHTHTEDTNERNGSPVVLLDLQLWSLVRRSSMWKPLHIRSWSSDFAASQTIFFQLQLLQGAESTTALPQRDVDAENVDRFEIGKLKERNSQVNTQFVKYLCHLFSIPFRI